MYFSYFQELSIKVPTNCKNHMKPVGACGNYITKTFSSTNAFEQKLLENDFLSFIVNHPVEALYKVKIKFKS